MSRALLMQYLSAVALTALGAAGSAAPAASHGVATLEEVVVRAEASVFPGHAGTGSVGVVYADTIELTRASHVNEVLVRVPGVWVSRGSGHEHLTAIRSGVLTGAGACGEFLLMENGVPIRPAGFCNVNNLFEVNTEQAAAIEVVRGPASALFGGNALHGVVNTVTHTNAEASHGSLEAGPYGYVQGRLDTGGEDWRFNVLTTSSEGYRDDTGYGQHKLYGGMDSDVAGWSVSSTVSATLLNQETGGFVRGFEAYDSAARDSNPNPEAYRDAWSVRIVSVWQRENGGRVVTLTPYLRRSSMAFLQHFLPGQPLEKNAQTSAGLSGRVDINASEGTWRQTVGGVAETFRATLSQRQAGPTTGSAFLVATRPPGTHYDYDVLGVTLAAFYHAGADLADNVGLVASARLEHNTYDYDNHHLVGNTRDDGSACGFGGCLYSRPADREDTYTNIAGRLGVEWYLGETWTAHAVAGLGFRPPQTTELYRLQRGQTVADLDSENVRSVEAGLRGFWGRLEVDMVAYAQTTRHLIFRDADGFNVSDGATQGRGVEAELVWSAGAHTIDLALAWSRHEYTFTRDVGGRERIEDGNEVDTAPRRLGSAHWRWEGERLTSELELVRIGSHFINASNTARYGGHTVLNWRGTWDAAPRVRLFARLVNLLDTAYADRADFAFGGYRYFPAMPRQVYVGAKLTLP